MENLLSNIIHMLRNQNNWTFLIDNKNIIFSGVKRTYEFLDPLKFSY